MGHISTVEVRYAETDQMGIAHHSNYAVWFEVARTDFIKAVGISYTDVEKEGIITPLTSLECKYKKAAFYEDQLQIHASLTKLSPVRLEFSQHCCYNWWIIKMIVQPVIKQNTNNCCWKYCKNYLCP